MAQRRWQRERDGRGAQYEENYGTQESTPPSRPGVARPSAAARATMRSDMEQYYKNRGTYPRDRIAVSPAKQDLPPVRPSVATRAIMRAGVERMQRKYALQLRLADQDRYGQEKPTSYQPRKKEEAEEIDEGQGRAPRIPIEHRRNRIVQEKNRLWHKKGRERIIESLYPQDPYHKAHDYAERHNSYYGAPNPSPRYGRPKIEPKVESRLVPKEEPMFETKSKRSARVKEEQKPVGRVQRFRANGKKYYTSEIGSGVKEDPVEVPEIEYSTSPHVGSPRDNGRIVRKRQITIPPPRDAGGRLLTPKGPRRTGRKRKEVNYYESSDSDNEKPKRGKAKNKDRAYHPGSRIQAEAERIASGARGDWYECQGFEDENEYEEYSDQDVKDESDFNDYESLDERFELESEEKQESETDYETEAMAAYGATEGEESEVDEQEPDDKSEPESSVEGVAGDGDGAESEYHTEHSDVEIEPRIEDGNSTEYDYSSEEYYDADDE